MRPTSTESSRARRAVIAPAAGRQPAARLPRWMRAFVVGVGLLLGGVAAAALWQTAADPWRWPLAALGLAAATVGVPLLVALLVLLARPRR